ncbi:MAG: response regulator [Planctomycetota bacterium]|nr:MAG: response regulator [Planctomycetota bacterium]
MVKEAAGAAKGEAGLLIVEDDPDALFLLKRAFTKVGLSVPVRVVMDGEDAVAYLSGRGAYADRTRHPLPCLVLLNLKLPKKSGLEVLEWIRQQPRLRRIPVVIVTTSGEERDRQRAMELGAREYTIKPIDSGGLLRLAKKVHTYTRLFCTRIQTMMEQDPDQTGTPPPPLQV